MKRARAADGRGALGLLSLLERLDQRLAVAVVATLADTGVAPGEDPYQGLHTSTGEALLLAGRPPLDGALSPVPPDAAVASHQVLAPLAAAFDLEPFDAEVLLMTAAAELDARYGRIYAYLQGDVSRRRPTIDLALGLFCPSREARAAAMRRFEPDAPLLRLQLIRIGSPTDSLVTSAIEIDEGVLAAMLGGPTLDRRLRASCELRRARRTVERVPVEADVRARLRDVTAGVDRPMRLALVGPPGCGQVEATEALACAAGMPLLTCRLAEAPVAVLALRQARLTPALVHLQDATLGDAAAAEGHPGPVVVSAQGPVRGWRTIELGPPQREGRRACWAAEMRRAGIKAVAGEIETLSDHFPFGFDEIRDVVADVADGGGRTSAAVLAGARTRAGEALDEHARRIVPAFGWDDVVLPAQTVAQLRELCERVKLRRRVLDEWGLGRKLVRSAGVTALFAGPSGTGKTMVAEVIAGELGLHLYAVDLSAVLSKYIGETEKNLRRLFDAAARAGAVLFFDEADALFGKRSEVSDSHDRYANIEVAFLLQEMERHPGVAILATNLVDNLDDAFARRLAFRIPFGVPDEEERTRIWARVWPAAVPLAPDVDAARLARAYELTGGGIRNAAVAAAFLAAAQRSPLHGHHVANAVAREFAKLGTTTPSPPRPMAVEGLR